MAHVHNDIPHTILTLLVAPAGKWVIDFDLRNRNNDLLASFSALIYDFFLVNQNSIIKNDENQVLRIFENLLFMDS